MSCMTIGYYFLCLQITKFNTRPHVKWVVQLGDADGHFNLPLGSVWVCMGKHTHFITQEKGALLRTRRSMN